MEGQQTGTGDTTQQTTGDATGQTAGQQATQHGNGGSGDAKTFTQAELDAIVKDRLDRATRAADAKSQKEREAAEAKALEDQQQFKELADQRATKIAALEPLADQLKEANEALTAALDRERKDLPAHITSLLDDKTPAAQLTWIAANREAIAATGQQTTNGKATSSIPGTPKGAGQPSQAEDIEQRVQKLRASGAYSRW